MSFQICFPQPKLRDTETPCLARITTNPRAYGTPADVRCRRVGMTEPIRAFLSAGAEKWLYDDGASAIMYQFAGRAPVSGELI